MSRSRGLPSEEASRGSWRRVYRIRGTDRCASIDHLQCIPIQACSANIWVDQLGSEVRFLPLPGPSAYEQPIHRREYRHNYPLGLRGHSILIPQLYDRSVDESLAVPIAREPLWLDP